MILAKAYAAKDKDSKLAPWNFERREIGPHDVHIRILYCGVCHSDIHQITDDWGDGIFPMVPGHEIVGRVINVGSHVNKFKVGELAGVGNMVDTCGKCGNCRKGDEQYCTHHSTRRQLRHCCVQVSLCGRPCNIGKLAKGINSPFLD